MYSNALGREVRHVDHLIGLYAESHRHPTNVTIHWICVPIIFWCTMALLWTIHPWVAVGGVLFSAGYYARLSWPFTITMTLFALLCLYAVSVIPHVGWVALAVFITAWVFQFIGHKIEGKKPSFLDDLQMLLVGPIFLLAKLFRRIGVQY